MKKINASPEQLAKAMFDSADRKSGIRKVPKSGAPLKVIAGAPDRPLAFNDIEVACYVLEDETRVLSQRGVTAGIGLNPDAGFRMPQFLSSKAIKPFVSNDLMPDLRRPILFKNPSGGGNAYGYPATILADICAAVKDASDAGKLHVRHRHIVKRCDVIYRALVRVGIVALVDEATGYQKIREQRALATILEKYIAKELRPWTKTFPYEFYEHIYRLKGWDGPHGTKRPAVIGHYTNDFVYSRIAPGVLRELQRRNPVQDSGNRRSRHHQWFMPELGHPKLREHLAGVLALMRVAPSWDWFKRNIAKAYPKLNEQIPLELDE